ncbi:MAG: preprotein translocase subunit SecE [Peptococcaceae bacterium]|nr:preprotein translocase subunit SecE [Peptococcaceae bacterium]
MSNKQVEEKKTVAPKKAEANKKAKEKKPGFFARLKKSWKLGFGEMKKVHWPTRKEVTTYTGVVLVTVAIITVLIWAVDSGITALFSLFI